MCASSHKRSLSRHSGERPAVGVDGDPQSADATPRAGGRSINPFPVPHRPTKFPNFTLIGPCAFSATHGTSPCRRSKRVVDPIGPPAGIRGPSPRCSAERAKSTTASNGRGGGAEGAPVFNYPVGRIAPSGAETGAVCQFMNFTLRTLGPHVPFGRLPRPPLRKFRASSWCTPTQPALSSPRSLKRRSGGRKANPECSLSAVGCLAEAGTSSGIDAGSRRGTRTPFQPHWQRHCSVGQKSSIHCPRTMRLRRSSARRGSPGGSGMRCSTTGPEGNRSAKP